VKNDKSMTSLVNNGQSWMEPMMALEMEFEGRNVSENRMDIRRNKQVAVREDGTKQTHILPNIDEILKDLC
jgi:DNA sulfur modification protein DndC